MGKWRRWFLHQSSLMKEFLQSHFLEGEVLFSQEVYNALP